MESNQARLTEAGPPCETPKTENLLHLQRSKSNQEGITEVGQPELESNQDRVSEARQTCETPKTENLINLQSSKPNQEGILTEAGTPFVSSKTIEPAREISPHGEKAMPEERENMPLLSTEDEVRPAKNIVKEEFKATDTAKEEDEDENGEPEQTTSEEESESETAKLLPEAARENERQSRPKAEDDKRRYKIFVIGKTGTGKSTLCNTIVGKKVFTTGRSFKQVTTETREETTEHSELKIIVVDTPDISDESQARQKEIVNSWKRLAQGFTYMVVLAVGCDQRYSPAEYDVYRQIRDLWGRDLCRRLVVAFTFADTREDPSADMKEELKQVWPELKDVIKDAGGRHVVFNNKPGNTDTKAAETLTDIMEQLPEDSCWWKWSSRAISVVLFGADCCCICCYLTYIVTVVPRYAVLKAMRLFGWVMNLW